MMQRLPLLSLFLLIGLTACLEDSPISDDCQAQVVQVNLRSGKPVIIQDNWLRDIRYEDSLSIVKQYSLNNSSLCRSSYYYYENSSCYLIIDTVICGPSISHVARYEISIEQDTLWKRGRMYYLNGGSSPLDSLEEYFVFDAQENVIAQAKKYESYGFAIEDYTEYRYSENSANKGFLFLEWKLLGLASPQLPNQVLLGDTEPHGEWYTFEHQTNTSGLLIERKRYKGLDPKDEDLIQCQEFQYF